MQFLQTSNAKEMHSKNVKQVHRARMHFRMACWSFRWSAV